MITLGLPLHGIREHAMGAILNGMSVSKLRVFGSTFLIFSDYMGAATRLSALMDQPVIYVFTHDSITPIEEAWAQLPVPDFPNYPAVSEGPRAAEELIRGELRGWHTIAAPLRRAG